jgi:hypothetical protein
MTPTPYQHDPAMTPGSTTVSSKYGTCTWTRGSRHDRDVHPGWGFGILMISTLITILDILVHVSLSSLIILRCPCDHDHNVSGQTIMSGGPRVSLHHPGEQYLNLELYKYIQTYFLVYPIITVMITLLRATFGENKSKPSGMRTLYSHGLRIWV